MGESNSRPPHCRCGVLPTELMPHKTQHLSTCCSAGFMLLFFKWVRTSPPQYPNIYYKKFTISVIVSSQPHPNYDFHVVLHPLTYRDRNINFLRRPFAPALPSWIGSRISYINQMAARARLELAISEVKARCVYHSTTWQYLNIS